MRHTPLMAWGEGPMGRPTRQRNWFWVTLTLSSITVVALVLAVWELLENRFFRNLDYVTLHYLYISRGIAVSLILAFWAAWFVLRERKEKEEHLRRSSERYRAILDGSPSAILLLDSALRISECNAAAERLYGYSKDELLGEALPTVPEGRMAELATFMRHVESGQPVLDVETQRQTKSGSPLEVQVSLLPFRERADEKYFLEITDDIRERVRLRQTLLQIEKLTTMGQMAAGTAHHLNTPLAAMLLRMRMMREGKFEGNLNADLERLETSMVFCQHFVQQLLRFSRSSPWQKQPESIAATLRAVASFLSPQLMAKRVRLTLDVDGVDGTRVLADRNQLEALFLILLSNAADAVGPEGTIRMTCARSAHDSVEVRVADNGCGIDPEVLPHIFEPFFTTKAPGVGTGLGLAIASNILQAHGGTVRLDSVPRQGTTAIVNLPVDSETTGSGASA
ncbi:MAG: PAS domain S-box protein [Acidobacteriia bacterium]|nr:PAS domain S-box protein [Terriglobia bacterium]